MFLIYLENPDREIEFEPKFYTETEVEAIAYVKQQNSVSESVRQHLTHLGNLRKQYLKETPKPEHIMRYPEYDVWFKSM